MAEPGRAWRRGAALALAAALAACASAPSVRPPAARPPPTDVPTVPPPAPAPPPPPPPPPIVAPPPPPPVLAPAPAVAASAPGESSAVAERFPEPALPDFATPAFAPGRSDFTSNAELALMLQRIASQHAETVRRLQVGSSQTGVPIEALAFSREPAPVRAEPGAAPGRPTVLLIGQQHGDEPAGAEALLVVVQSLAGGPLASLLDRINVVVLPRANPDGASAGRRSSASGIDINRDHLLLRTPEAQAQAQLVREFDPVVVVDAHEYSAVGRYLQKFGAVQRFDALLQYATVANLPEFVTKASEAWFRQPIVKKLKDAGLTSEWYYTTSSDLADKKLSMGGVQPDTGRNVDGLRNAVSLLVETRGSDLGRAHLKRRVATHVTAIGSVLASAAARAGDLLKLRQFVNADLAARACQGDVVVEAGPTPSEYSLTMLDPATGADKPMTVAWDSALALIPSKTRSRPCGYWLDAEQTDAVMRLRALGVQIQRIDEAAALRGETYHETARDVGPRRDVRGSIADAGDAVSVKVTLVPALVDAAAGSYYVSLEQPFANLVVAALEPDTQSSFFASGVVGRVGGAARLMVRPEVRMTPLP